MPKVVADIDIRFDTDEPCLTADDVRAAAAAVRRRRQSGSGLGAASVVPTTPIAPPDIPDTEPAPSPAPAEAPTEAKPAIWCPGLAQELGIANPETIPELREPPKVKAIQIAVCGVTNTRLTDMLSSRRTMNIVLPRQLAMALSIRLSLRSLPDIGRRFGGRDHTTVLHAGRKLEPVLDKVAAKFPGGASVEQWATAAWDVIRGMSQAEMKVLTTYYTRLKRRPSPSLPQIGEAA